MPLPRRRSSFFGQQVQPPQAERPSMGNRRVSVGSSSGISARAPGVYVGIVPTSGADGLTTRVSRRALCINSVYLLGLRSSTTANVSQGMERSHSPAFESLNGCLLEYMEKVHALEQVNRELEDEIRVYLDKKASNAGSWGTLRQDWEDIYRQVSDAILHNSRLMLQMENVQANAEDFKDRYENEQPFRKAVEDEINCLYKVIDDANLTKMDLESQIDNLREELSVLAKGHEEDVKLLYNQLAGSQLDEQDAPIETSLDHILEYIRSHWEKVVEQNRAETDAYLELKQPESVNAELSQEEEELESLKTECNETGCKIQSLQAETESMRALKRGLENSLYDAKHWHDVELQNLGTVISKLEAELAEIRGDIQEQKQDYEILLENKGRLELEIGTYHGILDGEESRWVIGREPDDSVVQPDFKPSDMF
ncbi:phakinin [Erpetoichthys calabaricus]|uniref:phakinin n=1 Tax=Erpetoichthys calabaricus TaxID=27687 RepID=UPI0010A0706E|nr:phakinin [Erpetoichthys calabaricus]